jgi:AcrR family transcriptional regulator
LAKVSDAHLEARRRSIIDAATTVFSRKGIEIATMAEVAAEAGISPGAIYRYFANKEQLAHGCMSIKTEAIEAQWQQTDDVPVDPMAAFYELSRLTFAELNEPASRIDTMLALEQMLMAARGGPGAEVSPWEDDFPQVVEGIAVRLRRAQENGQLPAGTDVHSLAGALFSFYWGARLTRMLAPSVDTDAQLKAVRTLMDGAAGARAK